MNKHTLFTVALSCFLYRSMRRYADGIYQKRMDKYSPIRMEKWIYMKSEAPLEKRVQDLLSQMTLEEKSCQMATLYGSGRVLRCPAPRQLEKQRYGKTE